MSSYHQLQELIFGKSGTKYSELYQRGVYKRKDNYLLLQPRACLSFDTYFNMFSVKQWDKYTNVNRLTVFLELHGRGITYLYGINADNEPRLIVKKDFNGRGSVVLLDNALIVELPEYIYIVVEAKSDTVVLGGGVYTADNPEREINVACCFCTFRREQELIRNVENLLKGIVNNPTSLLYRHAEIFISDNGHTLTIDNFSSIEFVHLYKNKNYGGSSGFTRCLIEAKCNMEKDNFSHIVLMDDDALIQPYVVERTAALLFYLKDDFKECMLGGALLSLHEKWLQMENGSMWMKDRNLLRGRAVDLSIRKNVIENQKEVVNYNGWFYACIPASFVNENNLPLPLFLHGDDIDYGLRNKNGFIRINGICIWHSNPLANRRPYISYYNARNYTIVNNGYVKNVTKFDLWKRELRYLLNFAFCYRYEDTLYRLRGCEDYLKGIDWLKVVDAEKLNTEIMSWKNYDTYEIEDINSVAFEDLIEKKVHDNRKRQILNWLLPAQKDVKIYSNTVGWDNMDVYRIKKYCIIDEKTGKGIVLRKSYWQLFLVIIKFTKVSLKIFFKFDRVSTEWRERLNELKKYSFWKEYLEI